MTRLRVTRDTPRLSAAARRRHREANFAQDLLARDGARVHGILHAVHSSVIVLIVHEFDVTT